MRKKPFSALAEKAFSALGAEKGPLPAAGGLFFVIC